VSARGWRALTVGVPLAFLTLFFLYPLAAILDRGLRGGEGDSALAVLSDPVTREVVWFTVWQALASTVLTIAVAMPAAYVLGRYRFRGRSVVSALVVVPFVLPTVVVALAFVAILPDGIERGWAPILVAHAFFNVAVVVRIVGTYWANVDPRVGEAAATLGAGPVARFREITAPLLAPAVAAAAAIVFLFSFTSFGVVLILGGPRYATIEAEIYNQAVRLFDLRAAAVLSLVQLACVVAAVWVATRLERRVTTPGTLRAERDTLRRVRTRRDRLVVGASLGSLGLFLGLPLVVLVERSLAVGGGHGLDAYRALGRPTSVLLAAPWEAVVNSIVYAAAATLIALVVGGLAAFAVSDVRNGHAPGSGPSPRQPRVHAEKGHAPGSGPGSGPRAWPKRTRALDGLILLPLGMSAVMLGLGFLIAFDTPPLDFRAAPWLVPVAQALVAIPFVVRIVAPTLRSIDPRQREAAALLGASPGRVRREIDLPIISRGLAVAAGFAFAISLGEFGATVFLARPDRPTLPVAIFRFLGRPGEVNVAQAYALAVVLMTVTVVSVLLVERVRVHRGGWF
jgi:thiamine transport system permease protein